MKESILSFEQGPIRPPNEARSLLLRLTRNCPWNKCLFCPVYKKRKFSLRSVDEIKDDIRAARRIADSIIGLSKKLGYGGQVNNHVFTEVSNLPDYGNCHRSIAAWLYYETGACFLQDADNLVMTTHDLVETLSFLRKSFPEINRVTTYSRSATIYRKSLDSMKKIKDAGLDRIHIGLETAHDPLLKFIKKGVDAERHVAAGRRVIEAGIELSEYVMPGLGGTKMWKEHAVDTAKALNRINPHFIRLRSLRVPRRVPLYEKLQDNTFSMLTDDGAVKEIRLFIENLDGIDSTITSDHMMNLLEGVSGKLPHDKEKMLGVIDKYLNLSPTDRMIFRAGRRGGAFRSTDDLANDHETYEKIKSLIERVQVSEGEEGVETMITELVDRYI